MPTSMLKFSEVEARNASPSTIRHIIKDVLQANDDACASEIERFLVPPGVAGSREYDHAYAVQILLEHDAKDQGRIAVALESTPLSRRMLWDQLVAVYRSVGFQFKHGRLVGVLEDKSNETDNDSDTVE